MRGGVAVMHSWGHTEMFTQRHRSVCVNTDTQTHRHTGTARTLHPPTAQVHPDTRTHTPTHRYTPTHRHTPQHDRPCTPSGCHHTHTYTHTQRPMSPTRTLTPSPALHTQPHSHKVSLTGSVTHMRVTQIQCRVHTVPRSVTHPVSQCHTPRVTLTVSLAHSPQPPVPARLCRPSRLWLRAVTEPRRALPNRTVPCRAGTEPNRPC